MLYLKITKEGEESLIHYCRKCGNNEENIVNESSEVICVSKTHIKKKQQTYKNIINEYTKLDPTLPRIRNIKCPNPDCTYNSKNASKGETKDETKGETKGETKDETKGETKGENLPEIIYLRYDNENMKYIYLCTACNNSWKNN